MNMMKMRVNKCIYRPGPIITTLVIVGFGLLSAPAADQFSNADREEAVALVGQLEADGFAKREAALNALETLPITALPWLEELIASTRPTEIELRSRLKSVVRTLKKRDAEVALREGTQVKIDLKAATPGDILESFKDILGSSLTGVRAKSIWGKEVTADFSFEGSFWDAVDGLLETFPPEPGGRENLGAEHRIGRWGESDFSASGNASVNPGILRVRPGRMALENTGGKDYLVVTLVPSVEPTYQVEELSLMVKGLTLEDGTELEPEKKICEWKSKYSGARYSPSGVYTWIFPLEKGVNLRGAAGLEGIAKIKARRLNWAEVELPENLDDPVNISSSVELKVLEREAGRLKIQFEGKGSEPACFDDYELRKEAYQVLDKDGKVLDFNVNSSSSGGGNGWRNSYAGRIEGEPARVRAKLPGGEQEVQLKFNLADLPMPGSSLID